MVTSTLVSPVRRSAERDAPEDLSGMGPRRLLRRNWLPRLLQRSACPVSVHVAVVDHVLKGRIPACRVSARCRQRQSQQAAGRRDACPTDQFDCGIPASGTLEPAARYPRSNRVQLSQVKESLSIRRASGRSPRRCLRIRATRRRSLRTPCSERGFAGRFSSSYIGLTGRSERWLQTKLALLGVTVKPSSASPRSSRVRVAAIFVQTCDRYS